MKEFIVLPEDSEQDEDTLAAIAHIVKRESLKISSYNCCVISRAISFQANRAAVDRLRELLPTVIFATPASAWTGCAETH